MRESLSKNPCWYRATNLDERIGFFRDLKRPLLVLTNKSLSQRRFQEWRAQHPFGNEAIFEQRLGKHEITELEFRWALGESGASIRARSRIPPRWLQDFAKAFSLSSVREFPLPQIPAGLRYSQLVPILAIVAPLINFGYQRLQEKIQAMAAPKSRLPFARDTVTDALYESLPYRLLLILSRAAILELNVARLRGTLKGATPEKRFEAFAERMGTRSQALRFLREYPVLTRSLSDCVRHWTDASSEFLQHLCGDWQIIQNTFFGGRDPGPLVNVHTGVGDQHNRGRSVVIATFASGSQLVYKPRSLSVDLHFHELLAWLNSRGSSPDFRTVKILTRETYGWMEFVTPETCKSEDELKRFYQRQGAYLAILYSLEAQDIHFENLIAAGEHPILLDLEALFHPRIHGFDPRSAEQVADGALFYSVLGVGLLPHRIKPRAESEAFDFSGMGAPSGQMTPFPVPQWEEPGTDKMRITRKRVLHPGAQNRPTMNGSEVSIADFMPSIVSGFSRMYELLMKHRAELLHRDGPIARFADDEVRVIFRPTQTYSALLHESLHPDVLRDAVERDRLFDRLWSNVEQMPFLADVIASEREDLWNGDIPKFTTQPNVTDVWSTSGKRIPHLLDEPGINLARRRLEQLNAEDLERQVWVIRASVATAQAPLNFNARALRAGDSEPTAPADPDELLRLARAVGDQLSKLALRGEDDVSWIGLAAEADATAKHTCCFLVPLGLDLYDGLPGVLLFLAFLGAVTGEERYTTLARAALTTLRRQINRSRRFFSSIGGFGGWPGIIYTLRQLGELWSDPALISEAEDLIELLFPLIRASRHFDMVHGAGGCIVGLLSLQGCTRSNRALDAARECGDKLVALGERFDSGFGWRARASGNVPLAGFSHGAAGVAWALLKLSELTRDRRFRAVAEEAIRYERSLFSPQFQNWPDLRSLAPRGPETSAKPAFMVAWCNGAPGIGLARLASLAYLDDDEMRTEIHAALGTTLKDGFGGNHSLCHGDLGNVELLLQASEKLGDPQWAEHLSRKTALILDSIKRNGFVCGVPSSVESPGLMTGLAGIGYELLRLVEPQRVPCVLLLEPLSRASALQAVA